jgi:sugar phosphate isomerase/epimerase
MKLGFVSAILPDLSLEQVLDFAGKTGYRCVEVMCWPAGKAERRYAGVSHIDCAALDAAGAEKIKKLMADTGVEISGLGYYPNPLTPDKAEADVSIAHLGKVIAAAKLLGLTNVNTFIGRDWTKSVEDNWPRFREVWPPLIKLAEENGIRIGIENCPMSFTKIEWPGGKNLATSPKIWRQMFQEIPSANFGLNFDPSHFVWQQMDYLKVLRDFADKMFHLHAKDARIDIDRLNDVGMLSYPNDYHTPKLPGLGDVKWGPFFATLGDIGYRGPICVEVEDRSFEGSLELRKASLVQSLAYLRQFATDPAQFA